MSRRPLLALGAAALLVGLVAQIPASWLAQRVQARAPAVKLAGVAGTAFAGRAQYLIADGVVVRDVEWRLRPAALAADLTVATDNGRIRATVRRGPGGGIRVTGAEGDASLAWFGRLIGYHQLPVSGDVSASLNEAAINVRHAGGLGISQIDGRLRLTGAHWELARPPIALGGFTGTLTTEDDAVTLQVAESDGPLAVTGTAQLAGGDRYELDLRLHPRAGADERLKSTLGLLGRPDAEGAYRVRERGRF